MIAAGGPMTLCISEPREMSEYEALQRAAPPLFPCSRCAATGQVRLAASAYLARFTGSSCEHTESDLRCYLRWGADRGLDPLAAPPGPGALHPVDARSLPVHAPSHLAAV